VKQDHVRIVRSHMKTRHCCNMHKHLWLSTVKLRVALYGKAPWLSQGTCGFRLRDVRMCRAALYSA